jgi:hypothetical protein
MGRAAVKIMTIGRNNTLLKARFDTANRVNSPHRVVDGHAQDAAAACGSLSAAI